MNVLVRAAGVGDLENVIALERGAAEAPHWTAPQYRAALAGEGSIRRCLLVAELKGVLVGFAVGRLAEAGDEILAELESVAVAVEARRQGVGRMLCESVATWCSDQGATTLELEVRASSVGAKLLYEEMGFGVVGRRRDYYRDPVDDALLMRLEL